MTRKYTDNTNFFATNARIINTIASQFIICFIRAFVAKMYLSVHLWQTVFIRHSWQKTFIRASVANVFLKFIRG